MKKNMSRLLASMMFFTGLISLPLTLYAATSELYQGVVPVASYSSSDFKGALTPALTQVLIKMTGNTSIATISAIKTALDKPDRFVQSYNYSSTGPDGKNRLSLVVRFSPKLVNELLRSANQTTLFKDISPQNTHQSVPSKPKTQQTLVWLVIKNANGQPEVLNNPSNAIVAAMQASAKQKNISLLWPVMDLQDISVASPDQVWQMDPLAVEQASRRYQADAVLIGKLEQEKVGNEWQGKWLWLDSAQNKENWETTAADPTLIVTSSLTNLMKVMTKESPSTSQSVDHHASAGQSVSSTWVEIKVSGIYSLDDYADVIKYLRRLRSIESVNAAKMREDSVIVKVQVNGGREALIRELNGDPKLIPDLYGTNNNASSLLLYHWDASKYPAQPVEHYENPEVQSFPADDF